MHDRVAVGIASIPSREAGLRRVVEDVLPQCDVMYVYLDRYPTRPAFLDQPKIVAFSSEKHGGLGCPGKFYRAAHHDGYFVAVDDDILYPPDYVSVLMAGIDILERRACVGVHGIKFLRVPVRDYYSDRTVFHFSSACPSDRAVDLLGSGTLAFHTAHVQVTSAWFQHPQLTDIAVAADLQRQGVPRICVARRNGWLRAINDGTPSLFDLGTRQRDHVAAVVNSFDWGSR